MASWEISCRWFSIAMFDYQRVCRDMSWWFKKNWKHEFHGHTVANPSKCLSTREMYALTGEKMKEYQPETLGMLWNSCERSGIPFLGLYPRTRQTKAHDGCFAPSPRRPPSAALAAAPLAARVPSWQLTKQINSDLNRFTLWCKNWRSLPKYSKML